MRERDKMLVMVEQLHAGEEAALLALPTPDLKQIAVDLEAQVWKAHRPRAPHDRGTGRAAPPEGMAAMMARLGRVPPKKEPWSTPELHEQSANESWEAFLYGDAWSVIGLREWARTQP